jgi:AcrR family transcriptional regulator
VARTKDPQLERRRREAVKLTTYRLLAKDSFQSVTLERVAREAGVSKGLVTYYFKTKDALFIETIASYHQRQRELLQGISKSRLPVRERFELLIKAAFSSQKAVADEVRFQIEIWSFAKSRPQVAQQIAQSYRDFQAACCKLVEVGIQEGLVTVDRPAERYAAIHAIIDGLSFQAALDPQADMDAIAAQAMTSILALLTAD